MLIGSFAALSSSEVGVCVVRVERQPFEGSAAVQLSGAVPVTLHACLLYAGDWFVGHKEACPHEELADRLLVQLRRWSEGGSSRGVVESLSAIVFELPERVCVQHLALVFTLRTFFRLRAASGSEISISGVSWEDKLDVLHRLGSSGGSSSSSGPRADPRAAKTRHRLCSRVVRDSASGFWETSGFGKSPSSPQCEAFVQCLVAAARRL